MFFVDLFIYKKKEKETGLLETCFVQEDLSFSFVLEEIKINTRG